MSAPARVLRIPDLSLVVLVGPSGSGKSTLAARHFRPTEVLSSDRMRGWVDDDETSMAATADAFAALRYLAGVRLRRRRLTVIDATSVRSDDRAVLVRLAKQHHALPVAIVLDVPLAECLKRNELRSDRQSPRDVIRRQHDALRHSLRSLKREGFSQVCVLTSPDEADALTIEREPLWPMRHVGESGPFDIVGDVHGCADELRELLATLGWAPDETGVWAHPAGRRAILVGDIVDRGPSVVAAATMALDLCDAGRAYWVPGNHDVRLAKRLRGVKGQVTHGLAESLAQIDALGEAERAAFVERLAKRVDALVSHLVLDQGRLVVAHAGMQEDMQGRASAEVRSFALFGARTGEVDEDDLPVRLDWAQGYRGEAAVVHGHVAVGEARWANNTLNIDTGCVFGGRLTALRWPERELVSVPAAQVYCEPTARLREALGASGRPEPEGLLAIDDVTGDRRIETAEQGRVRIRPEQSAAALEVMSRFAVRPEWLIYLPPTMSPCETSARGEYLEHPDEALAYYRERGVSHVLCEEKHMGSRAVLVVCRDPGVAARRFGIDDEAAGECYTRTGRAMLDEPTRSALLQRVREAVAGAGLWDSLATDWVCLDCEMMPWNAKARELLVSQYAPVAVAGSVAAAGAQRVLTQAVSRGLPLEGQAARIAELRTNLERYAHAYRRYCWPVGGLRDLRIAPFHLLASEGAVHADRDHAWHMETLGRLAQAAPDLCVATPSVAVDLGSAESSSEAIAWWERLTSDGGEGFVVKPLEFVARPRGKLLQPAVKCRGREYLRIIYGPDYTRPEHLAQLRERGLARKRELALREFALGLEGLRRFVEGEPLHRVHECAFGVLALESEPVDPRL